MSPTSSGSPVWPTGSPWAEDHDDVEIVDNDGKAERGCPAGMAGMARLHARVGEHLDDDALDPETGMLAPGGWWWWARRWPGRPAGR